ncbi:MAG TPA: filamentous hemagglutinin N-terminal domain-containing protein, partial [Burkholderiales bacterium]|nr:filamentous hemagglutinin N-terminal domain-containing protein [Burkholderiales bacterium]
MARTKRAKLLDEASRSRARAAREAPGTRNPLNSDPRSIALAVAAAFMPWFVPAAHAQIAADTLPSGGQVAAGAASISSNGSQMQIDQSTQRAILNWQSFSIGSSAWVNFSQPSASAVALNRVVGNDPSQIFGRLTANGQVFLVNNAGVLFAPGASVNVNALFATSLSINDQDFLAGRYQFFNPGNAGSVINQGNIVTANGYTALVGPQVRNDGVIIARTGNITLAAADRVSLDMVGDGLISISVDQATLNASVINTGTLQADGGTVLLAARSANALLDTVINNSGIIRANSLVERNGQIVLDGGSAGVVANSGALQAAGIDAGTTGGTIKVLGDDVRLLAAARLDASGRAGGGTVLVGGNFQGQGPEANASNTYVDADATILADAVTSGDGGKVIVWADQGTYFFGHISARGGAQSGDGGFVEVSGKEFLAFRGTADRRAPNGRAGTLLLDPTDMTITAAAGDVVCAAGTCTSNSDTSTLSTADLQTALSGGDVVVDATAGGGAGGGTINWTDGLVDANANSLALVGTSITFDGILTNLNNLDFSIAPTGVGSATSSTGGSITGIGSLTFALSALNAGTAGGITFSGFGSADSTTVTGAVGFDDTARSTLGMTFLSANNVSGSGTISNVAGSFNDATLVSAASAIDYSGFNAVSGTGTVLTGVDVSFDD